MRHTHLINYYIGVLVCILALLACGHQPAENDHSAVMLFEKGRYPFVTLHEGKYYFSMQTEGADTVALWCADQLEQLAEGQQRVIWTAQGDGMEHFWSPELHRLNNRWYLYFEADDGNTDDHQLFVMECQGDNPMTDPFVMKGPIVTNLEWNYGIHPNVIQLPSGEMYLFWSGWPKRRAETETQCIYLARLSDPWTICSERVMISKPEYEWERQWINPNGNRSAYPIYVNENPEAFLSPDGLRLFVAYSASGIWTLYQSLGLLSVPLSADLLDANAWTKSSEPLFMPQQQNGLCTANICVLPLLDDTTSQVVYEARWNRNAQGIETRQVFMQPMSWTPDGTPQFGVPNI